VAMRQTRCDYQPRYQQHRPSSVQAWPARWRVRSPLVARQFLRKTPVLVESVSVVLGRPTRADPLPFLANVMRKRAVRGVEGDQAEAGGCQEQEKTNGDPGSLIQHQLFHTPPQPSNCQNEQASAHPLLQPLHSRLVAHLEAQ
jgi:hypothetical protein